MLAEYIVLNAKSHLARQRKGAAVLETVLLIVMAIVIVGAIIVAFVGKDAGGGGILGQIKEGFNKIFSINPLDSKP